MYDQLTPSDIKKMEEEIEHRKLVIRRQALEDVKEARAWRRINSLRCSLSSSIFLISLGVS